MKITDMVVTPIAFTDPPLLNAAGLHAPYALRIIIEILTNENITGIGEISGGSAVLASLERARKILIGKDPFERSRICADVEEEFNREKDTLNTGYTPKNVSRRMYSAIDVALLDIAGKALEKPVVDLLGGRFRERVDFSAYLFYKYEGAGGKYGFGTNPQARGWHKEKEKAALEPEELVQQAQNMCREYGFKSLKLKGGVFHPQKEVDTIKALAKAFGKNVPLRIDPNAIWSLETSAEYAKQMEGILEYYEDPCKTQESMAALRKLTSIPLATNMCTTSFEELPSSIALGSEDIILADHHYWGGMTATMQLGKICSVFSRKLSMHSNSHLGISLMAMTHLGCAVPEIAYALDTHYPWQSEEIIKGGRIEFDQGTLGVSNEPGLGIELDHIKLDELHQNYINCGIIDRNDEKEMQKVKPGWKFANHRF
jgi:glucarate dehydratase